MNDIILHNSLYNLKYYINMPNTIDTNQLENINSMDYFQKLYLFKKIFNEKHITNELLKYEMVNHVLYKIKKEDFTIDEIKKYLKRYTRNTGGFNLDDWNLHTNKSRKYELNENQFIFDNKIGLNNLPETHEFIKLLVQFFKRNFKKVCFKMFEKKECTLFVIKFTKKMK